MAEEKKSLRLVLFPLPYQGHISPMLQLANILHSRGGFSITVIHTHFNSPNPANYPDFRFVPIPDGVSETEGSTTDAITIVSGLNVRCVDPFRECLGRLLAEEDEPPVACLISDAMLHFTRAVSDSFQLRRIVLRTSSVSSFLAFSAFPLFREKGYLPIQDERLEDPILELPPLKVKDIPMVKISNLEIFYHLIDNMVKEANASSALIWNSFQELEQSSITTLAHECGKPMFPIGPFHTYFPASSSSLLTQDPTSIHWLDKQSPNSVIYISFGSLAAMDEKEFVEVAWGLANSNQHFLWVVRPDLVRGSKWLEPLPSGFMEMLDGRGYIVKWAPQQEVLAHPAVAAFWTHNGWNSTLESICEGVPMICLPSFGDQMGNSRYVTNVWRVGLQLENCLDRGEIEKVIRKVMVEREGKEMRERSLDLKHKVQLCLRPGGSSYKSLESLIDFISLV